MFWKQPLFKFEAFILSTFFSLLDNLFSYISKKHEKINIPKDVKVSVKYSCWNIINDAVLIFLLRKKILNKKIVKWFDRIEKIITRNINL